MKLRRAAKEDEQFLFELRNDIAVRKSAFNSKLISIKTHHSWFKRKLSDRHSLILIAEEYRDRIGQIRFDIAGLRQIAEVDIAIAPEFRSKGLGVKLLKLGSKYVFKKLKVKNLVAFVKKNNEISVKIFSKAGFKNCGLVKHKRIQCFEMLMS